MDLWFEADLWSRGVLLAAGCIGCIFLRYFEESGVRCAWVGKRVEFAETCRAAGGSFAASLGVQHCALFARALTDTGCVPALLALLVCCRHCDSSLA